MQGNHGAERHNEQAPYEPPPDEPAPVQIPESSWYT